MNGLTKHDLVCSVYPNTRGFAFGVFEGPLAPVDWGSVEIRGGEKNRGCLDRISKLLGRYRPDTLVLQDMAAQGTRRAQRIRSLNEAVATLAESQAIIVVSYSRQCVRACFAAEGFPSKQRIAEAIAKRIPMFEHLVPPPRKPWHTEHPRMGLFDAAALALVFFQSQVEGLP